MKEGINERIMKKQLEIQQRAVNKVAEILQGEKPFAMERVPDEDKYNIVQSLNPSEMQMLIQEFGFEKVNRLVFEAKMWERKQLQRRGGEEWIT